MGCCLTSIVSSNRSTVITVLTTVSVATTYNSSTLLGFGGTSVGWDFWYWLSSMELMPLDHPTGSHLLCVVTCRRTYHIYPIWIWTGWVLPSCLLASGFLCEFRVVSIVQCLPPSSGSHWFLEAIPYSRAVFLIIHRTHIFLGLSIILYLRRLSNVSLRSSSRSPHFFDFTTTSSI
jgi:hypothetical protein